MKHRLDGLPRLRRRRDWQSLAYLAAFPALVAWQWVHGFWWPLYALMLFLTLGIGVIHHNHTHQRMWRGRRANRLTDFCITLLQGHPTFVFWPAHVANHHRQRHGPGDLARTYRELAEDGPDAFYRGRVANLIESEVRRGGGWSYAAV